MATTPRGPCGSPLGAMLGVMLVVALSPGEDEHPTRHSNAVAAMARVSVLIRPLPPFATAEVATDVINVVPVA